MKILSFSFFAAVFFSFLQVCWGAALNDQLKTPEVQSALDTLTKTPETMNTATLLHLGENSFPVRQKLISEAKNYIFVDVPYWHYDTTGSDMLHRILEKPKENSNFDLRVIQDWISPIEDMKKGSSKVHAMLKDHVLLWNSPTWQRDFSYNLKQHHLHDKMLIVDGEKLIVGGMNMADEYLQGGLNAVGWHDTDVLLEGPAAQIATADFLKVWQLGTYLKSDAHFPPWKKEANLALQSFFYGDVEDHDFQTIEPQGSSDDNNGPSLVTQKVHIDINDLLANKTYFPQLAQPASNAVPVRLIYDNEMVDTDTSGTHLSKTQATIQYLLSKSQKTAWFFMPYLTPDKEMMDILTEAAKRIQVRIITNSYNSWDTSKNGYVAQLSHYPDFLKAGIDLYEWKGHSQLIALEQTGCQVTNWPGNTLHSKIALFDGSVVMVGSNNMNNQSLRDNNETMALINDEGFAQQVAGIFNKDMVNKATFVQGSCQSAGLQLPVIQHVTADFLQSLDSQYHPSTTPVWSYPLGL